MSHQAGGRRKNNNRSDFRDFKEPSNGNKSRGPNAKGGGGGGGSGAQQRHHSNSPATESKQQHQQQHANNDKVNIPHIDDPMYERNLYVTLNLVGQLVEVQVQDGTIYEGVFHTATLDKGYGVVLKLARKKDPKATTLPPPIDTFVIPPSEFVQIIAKDAAFFEETHSEVYSEIKTDKDISRADFRERELVAWTSDDSVPLNLTFESTFKDHKGSWDQFEVNEKLFGVKTSFNEELYTTVLDKNSQLYKEKAKEATRIANEITSKTTSNLHLAEERGHRDEQDNDGEEDEEDRYGAVIREPEGKYVPPAKRAQMKHSESDKSKTKKPTTEATQKPETTEETAASPSVASEPKRTQRVPSTLDALNLDPSKHDDEVVQAYQGYKKEEKKEEKREETLASLKNFQLEMENKAKKKATSPTSSPKVEPRTQSEAASAAGSTPASTAAPATTPASTSASSASTSAASATTPAATTESKDNKESKESAAPASTTPAKPKSTLNPNAKAFKPTALSANAKPFTPSSLVGIQPINPYSPMPAFVAQPIIGGGVSVVDKYKPLNAVYSDAMKRKMGTESPEQTAPYWPYGRVSYRQMGDDEVYHHMRSTMGGAPYVYGQPPIPVIGYPSQVRAPYPPVQFYPSGQQYPRVPYTAQQPVMKQPYYPVPVQTKGVPVPTIPPVYPAQPGSPSHPRVVIDHNPTQPMGTTPYPYTTSYPQMMPPAVRYPQPGYDGQPQMMHHLPPGGEPPTM